MKNSVELNNEVLESKVLWYLKTGITDFSLPEKVIKSYERSGRTKWIWRIFSATERLRSRRKKYVFIGGKYRNLILGLPKNQVLVVGGVRELIFSMRNMIAFYPSAIHKMSILKLISLHEIEEHKSYQSKLIQDISCLIARLGAGVVVVISDSTPFERMWISASRRIGVLSVCIQHGLFNKNTKTEGLVDGKFADAILAYDEYQKNIISRKALNPENVFDFGYHSDIILPATETRGPAERNVCILGQPWPQYYPDTRESYLRLIKDVITVLKSSGIDHAYKPHPAEKNASYIDQLGCEIFTGKFHDAIEDYDVFVSLTSTALLEASLHGRIAIQVFDPNFSEERFDDIGYANLVEKSKLQELPDIIRRSNIPCLTAKYCSEPIVDRFLNTLRGVGIG